MIDIATERLLNLREAARLLPPARSGRPVGTTTLVRLIRSQQLEALRIGGRWVTSLEALQRYAERRTKAALGEEPARAAAVDLSPARRRELARIEARADRLGL